VLIVSLTDVIAVALKNDKLIRLLEPCVPEVHCQSSEGDTKIDQGIH